MKRVLLCGWAVMLILLVIGLSPAVAQEHMIRIAKLEIDSAYLEQYRAAVREHTKAALRDEPGVLTLYAMYDRARPTQVTILEIYADRKAYESHLKTKHFQKCKTGTLKMVRSLELTDVDPILFREKPGLFTQ